MEDIQNDLWYEDHTIYNGADCQAHSRGMGRLDSSFSVMHVIPMRHHSYVIITACLLMFGSNYVEGKDNQLCPWHRPVALVNIVN